MKKETRKYPTVCLSAYCGKCGEECNSCAYNQKQKEFWQWVKDHKAIEKDPIWCPNFFTATI